MLNPDFYDILFQMFSMIPAQFPFSGRTKSNHDPEGLDPLRECYNVLTVLNLCLKFEHLSLTDAKIVDKESSGISFCSNGEL